MTEKAQHDDMCVCAFLEILFLLNTLKEQYRKKIYKRNIFNLKWSKQRRCDIFLLFNFFPHWNKRERLFRVLRARVEFFKESLESYESLKCIEWSFYGENTVRSKIYEFKYYFNAVLKLKKKLKNLHEIPLTFDTSIQYTQSIVLWTLCCLPYFTLSHALIWKTYFEKILLLWIWWTYIMMLMVMKKYISSRKSMKINCDSLQLIKKEFFLHAPLLPWGKMTTTAKIDFLYVIVIKKGRMMMMKNQS